MKIQAYPIKDFDTRKYPVGCVTQYFAENPQLYKFTHAHSGWDIVSNKVDSYGIPVYSMYDCEVFLVDDDKTNGTGLSVTTINDGILCLYGHLSEILVKEGDVVKAGDTIGRMGNTGFVVSDSQNVFWDGKKTTNTHPGTHLHVTFKHYIPYESYIPSGSVLLNSPKLDKKIVILDYYTNGYLGGVDPAPFFGLGNAKVLFTKDMKEGDQNGDVRNLQIMLGVTPTGYYGPKTKAAVLSFQINNGVPLSFWERYVARGKYCGPKTREKLNSI